MTVVRGTLLTWDQVDTALYGDKKSIRRIVHERRVFAWTAKVTVSPNLEDNKRWCVEQIFVWFVRELSYYLRRIKNELKEGEEATA